MTVDKKYSIYIDSCGQWRWRVMTAEGKITAHSSEGFATKEACMEDARCLGYEEDAKAAQVISASTPESFF